MTVYTAEMERTNIYLDDDTRAAAQFLKELYSLPSDSAAIRFAVRDLALAKGWRPGGGPPKPSRQRRHSSAPGDRGTEGE